MATTYLRHFRLLSRSIRLFLFAEGLASFAYRGIYSVLFNLYLLRLGFGPESIGLVSAALWWPMILLSMPASEAARRWGVRRVMVVGMVLYGVGAGLSPLVEFLPRPLWTGWLLAAQSFLGIGGTLFSVCSYPFLMSAASPEGRSHAFSARAALLPLAGFGGSLTGGFLPESLAVALGNVPEHSPVPYRLSLLIASALFIPVVASLAAMQEVSGTDTEQTSGETSPFPWALVIVMVLFVALRAAGEGVVGTFSSVYLNQRLGAATPLIGSTIAACQLLAAPAALLTPLLVARWGRFHATVAGAMGVMLGMLPLALVPHWIAAAVGLASISVMASMAYPAFSVFHQEIVATGRRATMAGAIFTAQAASMSVISVAGGRIAADLGYSTVFGVAFVLTTASTLLFWAYYRVPRGELAPTPR